ncbi:hypothetical protein RFI_24678 [Reticulomyxa filosa]|uniref:Uncharacterized protein n=1 Tax=Reticulomyxa filosa TaxID=46433 RepID=X6MGY8_RETFI|nr:hypothetical protein RFI_24678 [Reticulomyxa filosa]|eukprot:ETO12697.1 hypothetical protein RFI_24678 [Reticulomyxa filosa]
MNFIKTYGKIFKITYSNPLFCLVCTNRSGAGDKNGTQKSKERYNASTTSIQSQTQIQIHLQSQETEIVSSEGMLDNMLQSLVSDVGKEMNGLVTLSLHGKVPMKKPSGIHFVVEEFSRKCVHVHAHFTSSIQTRQIVILSVIQSILDANSSSHFNDVTTPGQINIRSFCSGHLEIHISKHLYAYTIHFVFVQYVLYALNNALTNNNN